METFETALVGRTSSPLCHKRLAILISLTNLSLDTRVRCVAAALRLDRWWSILLLHSEVSAQILLSFNSLKEGLEVACAESLMVSSLDNFEEQSWAILERFRENLEKVTLVIVVDEDLLALEDIDVLLDLKVGSGHASTEVVVVGIGDFVKEQDTTSLHSSDGLDDGLGSHGDVLDTGAAVVLTEFLDLTLSHAVGRLVDGHLDLLVEIGHDD